MLRYGLFKLVLAVFKFMNDLTTMVIGYSLFSGHKKDRIRMFKEYQHSAHVMRVIFKRRKFELEGPKLNHFLVRHEKYTHPDIVLGPNASLMAIDERFALFAICDEDVNVYSHTTGPFFYINQFNHCTHLVRIPLESFIKLAGNVGDPPPRTKFVVLSNTGRCGSTLLTQLFEQLPNTVAISEPEVLMEFSQNPTFDKFSKTRKDILLQSCISMLFKSASQSKPNKNAIDIDSFVIKPKAHGISIAQDLNSLYPNVKNLYMYRHPVEYVKSVRSVFKSILHPIVRHIMVYAAFDLNMYEFIMRQFGQHFDDLNNPYSQKLHKAVKELDVDQNLEERFAALYCGNLLSIMSMAASGINKVHVVSYHELKDNTQSDMKRILEHCDMETFVTDLPENDSQNNSGLSRNRLRSYQTALKEEEILVVDKVLQMCGFPSSKNFPLEADALTDILGIKEAPSSHNVRGSNRSSSSRYNTLPEAYLKPQTPSKKSKSSLNYSKHNGGIPKNKTAPLLPNKTLWLPVNRFV